MGCFDVACGISSISIKHGDDALLLLLLPFSEYPESARERKVEIEVGIQQVFNEGPLGLYMPLCLPIRGKYNDYGSLEDVVKDDTLKAVENFFGASFEQIINIIHRGRYGTLHDEEVLSVYGNGLKVDRSYNEKAVTPKWLLSAGFTEKDGKYYHPDVTNIIKWGKNGKIEKTEEQKAYVEFKVPFKGSNETKIMPHIVYWENDKWNEIWQREQRDFCNTFMEKTKPMGWFADDYGVVLGIKKEMLKKALLLTRVSGMFIDGKIYDALTQDGVKTNAYFSSHGDIRSGYMNKFVMEKIGFDFVKTVDDKTKEAPKDQYAEIEHLYTHKDAPGFMFGVRERRSMATDMYRVNGDKLTEVKTYDGKRSYHPFSPDGLATMFKGETGNDLDLSGLDGVTLFDIYMLKVQDYIKKRDDNAKARETIKAKLEETPDDKKEEVREMMRDLFRLEDRSESRDRGKEVLGHLNFPFVWEFYNDSFRKPSKKFLSSIRAFKNFMTSLYGINRLLMPSAHFGQHGDYEDQLAFSSIIKEVTKQKILDGYGKEFSSRPEMEGFIDLMYNSKNLNEKPGPNKGDVTLVLGEEEVAVWNQEEEYGYLITEKGR